MKIKAVFLDFDDTLGNREYYANQQYRELVHSCGGMLDLVEEEAVVQDCVLWDQHGTQPKEYIRAMLEQKYGIRLPMDNLTAWWQEREWQKAVLYPGVEDTLHQLIASGYRLGIISNGSGIAQRRKLEKTGIIDCFDDVIISGDYGMRKPDPKLFLLAASRMNVQPEESVMAGDIYSMDVIGAYRAGMHVIWVSRHGYQGAPIPALRSVTELPEALEKLEAGLF